jgi:FkbM family methyltransferase
MRESIFNFLNKEIKKIPKNNRENFIFRYFHHYSFLLLNPKKPVIMEVQGNKMYVLPEDKFRRFYFFGDSYEYNETELFKRSIKEGDIVLDIGANIGYYSLIAAELINKGKVYAFEPDPVNYEIFLKNIKLNNYKNIVPLQIALSNEKSRTKLFKHENNPGGHSLSDKINKKGFIDIETISLDEFVSTNSVNNISFIKIDVEGAEGLVLEGSEKLLEKENLKILMEFSPVLLDDIGTEPSFLLKNLNDYGFKIKNISGYNKLTPVTDFEEFVNTTQNKNVNTNLFLEKT